MVYRPLSLLVVLAAAVASVLPAPALDDCLIADALSERTACVEARLAANPPRDRLQRLAPLLDSHPDTVAQVLERPAAVGDPAAAGGVRLEAERLDLLGQALLKLERLREASEALSASVALDDGTVRVDWRRPDGETHRVDALDPGNERLQRTARALLAAGRVDDAKPLLARALALGAGDWTRDTWSKRGGKTVSGLDPAPTPFSGLLWREPLPDLAVQLFGGEQRRLRASRGNVLLLDFWASWCQPCVRELPFIESLYRSRRDRGLDALAINFHEQPQEALGFAQSLGLTLPIGLTDRTIEGAFEIDAMPTVIVADRAGRIRGRWAGYEDDVEDQLTALIDELLDATAENDVELGQVLYGAGALDVNWIRVARRDLAGVAIVRADTGPRVAVGLARSLALLDVEGREDRILTRPASADRLRRTDLDGDGVDELLGFRPGSKTILLFDLVQKSFTHWEAPHPVFDAEVATLGDESSPVVMLGTLAGLWRADPSGSELAEVGEFGVVSGVSAAGDPGARLTILESGKRLHWLDRDLASLHDASVADDAWTLVEAAGLPAAGVAPEDVAATAAGRFLRDGGRQIAYGLNSGQLVIVDATTGETRFRAVLAGPITELAGGDLDGDGLDELVLIQGPNLALLSAPAPEGTKAASHNSIRP